jgi:hypothetical protein
MGSAKEGAGAGARAAAAGVESRWVRKVATSIPKSRAAGARPANLCSARRKKLKSMPAF